MATLTPKTLFTLTLDEKELSLLLKGLALILGLKVSLKPHERELAQSLNEACLKQELSIYQDKVRQTEKKIEKAQTAEPVESPPSDEKIFMG